MASTTNYSSRQKPKQTTSSTVLTSPCTEPPQAIQKAHIHRHHYPPHLKPPIATQTRSSHVSIQQTRLIQSEHEEYQQQLNTIRNIHYNNAFPIRPHKPPTQKPTTPDPPLITKPKWASFTYVAKKRPKLQIYLQKRT